MNGPEYDVHAQLRRAMESKTRPIIVAGVGVSRATAPGDAWTWPGLIEHAIGYAERRVPLRTEDAEALRTKLRDGGAQRLIAVASSVESELRASGLFGRWLAESVGELEVQNGAVIQALRRLSTGLATTNYDELLTADGGPPPIPWTNPWQGLRVLRGEAPGVLHFHGCYSVPESVVFGKESYDRALQHERAQFLQKVAALGRTLVFVGCGAGLEDPNFGALLSWLDEWEARHSHYRLCTKAEVGQHRSSSVIDVDYGDDHSALVEYLDRLPSSPADDAGAVTSPSAAVVADHRSRVRALAFHARTEKLATVGDDQMVRMWPTGSEAARSGVRPQWLWKRAHREAHAVAFSPDGDILATGGGDLMARLWSADEGEPLGQIRHGAPIHAVAFNARGTLLATAGGLLDQGAKIWPVEGVRTGEPLVDRPAKECHVSHGDLCRILSVAFGPNDNYFATAGTDGTARIWSLPKGVELWHAEHPGGATSVACDAEGMRLVSAGADGFARVYSIEALTAFAADDLSQLELDAGLGKFGLPRDDEPVGDWCEVPHGAPVVAVDLTADGTRIATVGSDSSLRVWDVEDTRPLELELETDGSVGAVAFSADGGLLATASRSGMVKLRRLTSRHR